MKLGPLYYLNHYSRNPETGFYEVWEPEGLFCLDYEELCQLVKYIRSFWRKTANLPKVIDWYMGLEESTRREMEKRRKERWEIHDRAKWGKYWGVWEERPDFDEDDEDDED